MGRGRQDIVNLAEGSDRVFVDRPDSVPGSRDLDSVENDPFLQKHLEPGDVTLAGAARREAAEESGIDEFRIDPMPVHLDLHPVSFCDPRGDVRHLDVRYAAVAADGAEHAASEESLDVRWWPVDALPPLEQEMHTLIRLARERCG